MHAKIYAVYMLLQLRNFLRQNSLYTEYIRENILQSTVNRWENSVSLDESWQLIKYYCGFQHNLRWIIF